MLAVVFCAVAAGFALRCLSLKHALREMNRELSQNQILHLPDRDLDRAMESMNGTLERIFSNLFQNAVRYARSGLEICLEEDGKGQVNIWFQNDGEGITEEEVSHLFDRFYRNESSRCRNGSGLGLTVARSLAELMEGTLTARLLESEGRTEEEGAWGRGTDGMVSIRFTLTLKLYGSPK